MEGAADAEAAEAGSDPADGDAELDGGGGTGGFEPDETDGVAEDTGDGGEDPALFFFRPPRPRFVPSESDAFSSFFSFLEAMAPAASSVSPSKSVPAAGVSALSESSRFLRRCSRRRRLRSSRFVHWRHSGPGSHEPLRSESRVHQ